MGSGLYKLVAWLLRFKTKNAAVTVVADNGPVAPVAQPAEDAGTAPASAEEQAPVIALASAADDELLIDLAAPAPSASESILPEPILPMAVCEQTLCSAALISTDVPQAPPEIAPTATATHAPSIGPELDDEALLIEAALQLRDLVTPTMPKADALSIAALMESAMAVLHDADVQTPTLLDADDTGASDDRAGEPRATMALDPKPVRRVTAVPKTNRPCASPQRPKRQILGEKAKSKPRRSIAASPAKRKSARPPQRVVWLAPRQVKSVTVTPAVLQTATIPEMAIPMPAPAPAIDTLASAADAVRAMFGSATPTDVVTQAA